MAKKQSKAKAKDPKKVTTTTAWDVYAQRKSERVYLGLFTDKTKALQYAESKGHHRSVVSFVERKRRQRSVVSSEEKKEASVHSDNSSVSVDTDVK
jgi:hypothetical protein